MQAIKHNVKMNKGKSLNLGRMVKFGIGLLLKFSAKGALLERIEKII